MKKSKKVFSRRIIIISGILIFIIIFISTGTNKDDLLENYSKNKIHIENLNKIFLELIPPDYFVHIEYKSENNIDFWVFKNEKDNNHSVCLFQEWGINPYKGNYTSMFSYKETDPNKLEKIKKLLKWNDETFATIYTLLNKANCISISNNTYQTDIGYGRSGMGMYFYYLFNKEIPESERKYYSKNNNFTYCNPTLVIGYEGGGFGDD